MKVKRVIEILEANGFVFKPMGKGDHRSYARPRAANNASVDGKLNAEMPPGTLT